MARYIVIWVHASGGIRSQCVTGYWHRAVRNARTCVHAYLRTLNIVNGGSLAYANEQIDKWVKPAKPSQHACHHIHVGDNKISLFCTAVGRKPRKPKPIPAGQNYKASVGLKELHKFRSKWPGHNLPDKLTRCVFHFAANGDLLDCEYRDRNSRAIDWRIMETVDDSAIRALVDTAQRKVHPQHAALRG